MLCMPPFVRFRFDDCNGLYRTPKDMAFVDELARRGHKPNMCVSMNALTDAGWKFLKRHYDHGTAEVAPHTWEGGVSLREGHAGSERDPCDERDPSYETPVVRPRSA